MRKEVIGNATLYLGDCLTVSEVADAVISDPPYGIAASRTGGAGVWTRRIGTAIVGDDRPFDPSPWLAYKDAILWGANHYADKLPASAGWLVWDKKLGIKQDDFSDGEIAWHKQGGAVRIYRKLWNGLLAHEPGQQRLHPMQKPIELMRWCIERARLPATILDPYMGCGTTGVAAMQMGLRFVGVEIEPVYFEIACERIENAQRQERLFA